MRRDKSLEKMSLILYVHVLHVPALKVTIRGRKGGNTMLATGTPEMKRSEAKEKESMMEEKDAGDRRRLLDQNEKVQKIKKASSTNKRNEKTKETNSWRRK